MFTGELERVAYYLLVVAFTYSAMTRYAYVDMTMPERENNSRIGASLALAVGIVWLIGLMPLTGHYTADRANYVSWYVIYVNHFTGFSWHKTNFVFDNFYEYIAGKGISAEFVFLPVSIIYIGCLLWACKRYFPNDTLLAFVVALGAFSSYSYGTNGAKAGAAASLFLVALAYRENKKLAALFCFLSIGFHHSMIAPIAAFVLALFIKEKKYFLYIWLVSLVMAAFHVTYFQGVFAGYSNERGTDYLQNTSNIVSGFRPDFILYSAIPILLGYYLTKKYDIKSEIYNFLWNVYTTTNAVFLLCTYASYINRIAYLSWAMYPVVILYPFLNFDLGEKQYQYLRYVVYGHLGFTLFMDIVYYG